MGNGYIEGVSLVFYSCLNGDSSLLLLGSCYQISVNLYLCFGAADVALYAYLRVPPCTGIVEKLATDIHSSSIMI